MNWLVTIAVKAALEWLMSLLVRLQERERLKQEARQEGRKEVAEATEKERQESDEELKAVINSSPTEFDAAIERMRTRSRTSGDN